MRNSLWFLHRIAHVSVPWLTSAGLTYSEAHQLLLTAWSAHAAGGVDFYIEILTAASIKQAETKTSLERVLDQLQGAARDCMEGASRHLDNTDARSAALALTCVSRALTRCEANDVVGHALCAAARIAVRETLAWRVQLNCVWGDRQSFITALEQAYGSRPLDHTSLSRILHAHGKLIGDNFPSAFLSKCGCEAESRGCKRPARKQKKGSDVQTAQ